MSKNINPTKTSINHARLGNCIISDKTLFFSIPKTGLFTCSSANLCLSVCQVRIQGEMSDMILTSVRRPSQPNNHTSRRRLGVALISDLDLTQTDLWISRQLAGWIVRCFRLYKSFYFLSNLFRKIIMIYLVNIYFSYLLAASQSGDTEKEILWSQNLGL